MHPSQKNRLVPPFTNMIKKDKSCGKSILWHRKSSTGYGRQVIEYYDLFKKYNR